MRSQRCRLMRWTVILLAIEFCGADRCVAGDHGFVQVAPSRRYFRFEDGTAFFVVGQNDWPPAFDPGSRSRSSLERYFRNLNEHGVNVLRVMLEAAKPEHNIFVETRPGVFNPAFERWMDAMVGLAERHDVYLIVVLYPNLTPGPLGNWRLHPYAKTNPGGIIEHHWEMVTSPLAKAAQKRRFRYFVDHWGRNSHIFSWELFNEFWHPDPRLSPKNRIEVHNRWIDEMGAFIKEYEQKTLGKCHLRSVSTMRSDFPRKSTGVRPEDTVIFNSENLDFASFHAYGQTMLEAMNSRNDFAILAGKKIEPERLVMAVHHTMHRMLDRAPDRPVLCTEDFQIANPRAKGYKNPLNPVRKMLRGYSDEQRHDLFNIANWAYLMSGAAGTTMRYPSGFFEDALYERMRAISRFAARVPWQRFAARPAHGRLSTARSDVIAMALADRRRAIGWLYHRVPHAQRTSIRPRVTFRGLAPGSYKVIWIDTETGVPRKQEHVRGDVLHITPPPFKGHIALIIQPTDPRSTRDGVGK